MRRFSVHILLIILLGLSHFLSAQQPDSVRLQLLKDSINVQAGNRNYNNAVSLAIQMRDLADESNQLDNHLWALNELGRLQTIVNEKEEALANTRACVSMAEQNQEYDWVIICATKMALIYFNYSQYDSARVYYEMSVEVSRDHAPKRLGVSLANLAFIYGAMNQREPELEYFIQALQAVDANPDSYSASGVRGMGYSALGDYYISIGELEKAEEYFQKKLALGKELDSKRIQFEAYNGLGGIYASDGNYNFEKAKAIFEIIASEKDPELVYYSSRGKLELARLYSKERQFSQAITFYLEAYEFFHSSDIPDFSSAIETEMGEVYMNIEQYNEARTWLEKGLSSARSTNLISRESNALEQLYQLDSIQGRFRQAFAHFQRFTQINDSLSGERTQNRIKELQIKYETEQTDKENLALKSDLELKEAQVQRQRIIQASVALVALVFILLALLIQRNYKRKKRDHDIIAKQAEELKELSRFKEGLVGMLVHDMRNPINAIIGFSEGTPSEEKQRNINRSGHRVLNMVTNMLDIQRFEEAKVELKPEIVDGRKLVAEAIDEVHLMVMGKSLRVENYIQAACKVMADPVLFNRILVNLLVNAIKYSKTGGTIFVETGLVNGEQVEFIVRDQGQGIKADLLPHIFKKFWHHDPERSGILPSTGLGLSFCKMAVEAHGGEIKAESVLDEGTSIIFTLPLAQHTDTFSPSVDSNGKASMIDLSEQDVSSLQEFLPVLDGLKVHEVSAINKVIKAIDQKGVNKHWIHDFQVAVYQGDQARYDQLLDQARKNAEILSEDEK